MRVKQSSRTGGRSPRRLFDPANALWTFKTLETIWPVTWHNTPETSSSVCIYHIEINGKAIYYVILLLIQKVINLSIPVHSRHHLSVMSYHGMLPPPGESIKWCCIQKMLQTSSWNAIPIHVPAHAVQVLFPVMSDISTVLPLYLMSKAFEIISSAFSIHQQQFPPLYNTPFLLMWKNVK